jgi:hypothetical protein
MAKALSTLANGSLVKDVSSTYYGQPIIFRVIDKNHLGYPSNSVTLITDRIIKIAGFDAKESGNADSGRVSYGNNRYRTSNLRQWLNSTGAANAWWTAQNLTDGTANTNNKDASPTTANMASFNGYDTEKGFLGNLGAKMQAALLATTLTVAKNTVTATRYNNAIASSGVTSVAYRVKAFDAAGLESAYQTSATRTVQSNNPPTISGSDSNLGTKTAAFTQGYTVTDSDAGATITVVEKIDSVQKRSYTATSGAAQTFSVTDDDFIRLGNGSHTLTITASDQYGASATRTYTFSRNEGQIEVSLITPLTADAMPERIAMTIQKAMPSGATFQVLACNNGNDVSPAWEDVTGAITSGIVYHFANAVKTAANWGVNFKVLVDRNCATGDCHISSIGGNFD